MSWIIACSIFPFLVKSVSVPPAMEAGELNSQIINHNSQTRLFPVVPFAPVAALGAGLIIVSLLERFRRPYPVFVANFIQ